MSERHLQVVRDEPVVLHPYWYLEVAVIVPHDRRLFLLKVVQRFLKAVPGVAITHVQMVPASKRE